MDFTTNIIDQTISLADEDSGATVPILGPSKPPLQHSANTVVNTYVARDVSSTNALPDSISSSWSKIAQANMSVRMYENLVRIASARDGWRGPGSHSLRAASLTDFLEFWSLIRDEASEPELSLAPDGSIHAEWFGSLQRRLDVRFGERKAFFGLLTSSSIVEGADHLAAVAQILKAHRFKPLSWSAR
jgi:hypothetical protein